MESTYGKHLHGRGERGMATGGGGGRALLTRFSGAPARATSHVTRANPPRLASASSSRSRPRARAHGVSVSRGLLLGRSEETRPNRRFPTTWTLPARDFVGLARWLAVSLRGVEARGVLRFPRTFRAVLDHPLRRLRR